MALIEVLAISGSLRRASINCALLRAAQDVAPAGVQVSLFGGAGDLPLFNPDLEAQLPPQVMALHAAVAAADALMIASPEYAHGVTGTIKNLLDWLVSFEPFINMPIAIINAAPRAHHADDALRETLKTMNARIVEDASIGIELTGAARSDDEIAADPVVAGALRAALAALRHAIANEPPQRFPSVPTAR